MSRSRNTASRWIHPRSAVAVAALALAAGCAPAGTISVFDVGSPPAEVVAFPWIELATDPSGDGAREDSADGRALAYHHDRATDMLWFRLETFGGGEFEWPAVSISIDSDNDQSTGVAWYGANKDFMVDVMLSVGPLEAEGDQVRGYNGITDAEGIRQADWINVRDGNLTFYIDDSANAYIIGVARTDIDPGLGTFNVIGSVGADARWNDDIGDQGHANIVLPLPQ